MAKYGLGRHHAATEVDHDGLILLLNPAKYGGITILGVGIMFITGAMFTGDTVTMEPLFSVENGGTGGIMMVMIMVPFMLVGFDLTPQAVEEINLPFREIGRVLMLSVLMAVRCSGMR